MGKEGRLSRKQKASASVWKISTTGILQVVLLFLSIFTVGGFFSRYAWYLDIFSHFRFQYFVFFLLISFLLLALKKWKTLMISIALCMVNLFQIIPLYIPFSSNINQQTGDTNDIKIVHFNVLTSNSEYKKAVEYINKMNPDIISLNEVNQEWINNLNLSQKYKYSVMNIREDNFGIALYSKLELKNPRIEYFGDEGLPSAVAEMVIGENELSILGTHPLHPSSDSGFKSRNRQFEALIEKRGGFGKSMVLLGDLNTTSWSYGFTKLTEGMKLYDSRKGYGIQSSWPTTIPLISVPIDHCLVSKDIKVLKREMGPNLGSDHRPVYVELRIPTASELKDGEKNKDTSNSDEVKKPEDNQGEIVEQVVEDIIRTEGLTVQDRFKVPEGFERVQVEEGSFQEYLRSLPLKPHGSIVKYYDGNEKGRDVHDAVIDIDVGERDLQQCADAVMRLRAEYLYGKGLYDRIHFNFTNGFKADYVKWMNGNRIAVEGNNSYWVKKTGYSKDYKVFRQYMDMVFAYAGTLSLSMELKTVNVEEMEIGDVFMKGALPGHCVIVVDMAVNSTTGEKIFMIAQSYMPAQDIHVLKNYNSEEISPWYSTDFDEVLETPEWTFYKDQLMRFDN